MAFVGSIFRASPTLLRRDFSIALSCFCASFISFFFFDDENNPIVATTGPALCTLKVASRSVAYICYKLTDGVRRYQKFPQKMYAAGICNDDARLLESSPMAETTGVVEERRGMGVRRMRISQFDLSPVLGACGGVGRPRASGSVDRGWRR